MLCPRPSYTAEYGWCQALTGQIVATDRRGSDLGRQLRVLLFTDQLFKLGRILDPDPQQPPGAVRLAVDDVGVIESFAVDLDDLTAYRRLDRGRRLLRLDVAHPPPGAPAVPQA